ncbi:MAG: SpoIID/LytB domain-containing protein [Cyanobacteria bacterium]|nr:SpoIID/LytB domain-containing protein [Cyanobacteriota bacterium]
MGAALWRASRRAPTMGIVCAWFPAVAILNRLPWCRVPRFWKRGAGLLALLGASATPAALVAIAGPSPFGGTPDQISLARFDEREPLVRVLLVQATEMLEPTAVGGPLQLRDGQGRLLTVLPEGERLRISRRGPLLLLERPDADGTVAPPQQLALQELRLSAVWSAASGRGSKGGADTPLLPWRTVVAPAGRSLPLVGLGRRRYRGLVRVLPEGDRLQAVNLIGLEHYLASVVGSEMPASWPAEALRAQAVAARTYALAQLKPEAPFDLRSTVASQVYRGTEAETDSTRSAVAATRSLVLSHGGSLIDAVFHSSSGGSTENSGELWTRQLPYLVSVPDQDKLSPWHQWSVRFEPDQLRRAFQETAGASRIEVLAASSTGRVRRARVIGPAGSLDLSGSELRQRLGLRSTLVQFRFEPPLAPGPAGGITTATAEANAAASALSRGGNRAAAGPSTAGRPAGGPLPPPPLPGADGQGDRSPAAALDPTITAQLRQEPLTASLPALEVVGRGFGHGVGMSQWGAYGLALQGVSYVQILRHYYRGAQLVAYPSR